MMHSPFLRRAVSLSCWLAVLSATHPVCAQPASLPQDPPPAAELTDGLLDLLKTPAAAPADGSQTPQLTPAEVDLAGEDLGEQAGNPLAAVRQSMLIAAGWLQRGAADARTQELQTDIVQRLDELIAELEQASASEPPPNQTQREQATSTSSSSQESQSTGGASAGQSQASAGDAPESQSEAGASPAASTPGQRGAPGDGIVDLSDPQALQQSVWGHLPERLRTQMQSRMVESFLPSYREQIEAYFKALLEQ